MKTSLLVFGVVFLALGAILAYLPSQWGSITGQTIIEGESTVVSGFGSVFVPSIVTYGLLIIGAGFFILGLIIPEKKIVVHQDVVHVDERPKIIEKETYVERRM